MYDIESARKAGERLVKDREGRKYTKKRYFDADLKLLLRAVHTPTLGDYVRYADGSYGAAISRSDEHSERVLGRVSALKDIGRGWIRVTIRDAKGKKFHEFLDDLTVVEA